MTRQIATAILLATLLTMVIGGLLTYWTARATLLAELDRTLIERATAALAGGTGREATPAGDRFLVENERGRTVARSQPTPPTVEPVVISRSFTRDGDGDRLRTLALDVPDAGGRRLRVIYSSPAAAFDRLQVRLGWTIAGTIAVGIGLTIATAALVSRRVTRPLQRTADVIAGVDDSRLDRRLDAAEVPIELRPMVEHLNRMLGRLQEAFERQRRFLADAAHELRTPVSAIRASCEIALSRPRSAEQLTDVTRRSLHEALHLARLVEALLGSARGGTRAMPAATTIDLTGLLNDCVDEVRPLAEERGQQLESHIPSGLSILADATALRSVISNLLSNAIAYTQPGGQISLACDVEPPGRARVDVRDNGPGIAPENLDRIFEPFFRADPSRSSTQHLGLGLHLVRANVQRMGGDVSVRSAPNEGSTFTVRLPIVADTAPQDTPAKGMKRLQPAFTESGSR